MGVNAPHDDEQAADKFDDRGDRAGDLRQRHAHAGERLGGAG